MHQIPNGETCPDEHTYSLVTYLRTGPATIGTFCTGGTITTILVLYKALMTLQVPGHRKLDPVDFTLSNGPETSSKFTLVGTGLNEYFYIIYHDKAILPSLGVFTSNTCFLTAVATVKVSLPRGVSNTGFITANYPRDFPDKQQAEWDFVVPGMHNYTVYFQAHTAPECLRGEVEVEYHKKGKSVTQLALTDLQPEHQQGNFKMVLRNCETNRTLQGLALDYRVSVMRSGHPGTR